MPHEYGGRRKLSVEFRGTMLRHEAGQGILIVAPQAALKKGIFMTAATEGVLKFWEPLQNVSLATLNESEFGESIDFIIPVVG